MLKPIRFWLSPPSFEDEEKTRKARLLYIILVILLIAALIFTALLILRQQWSAVPLPFLGVPFYILLNGLARGGKVWAANALLVVTVWILVTLPFALPSSRGIYDLSYTIYILPVMLAGVLLSGRAGAWVAIVSMGMGSLLLLIALSRGEIDMTYTASSAVMHWIAGGLLFVLVSLILALVGRSLNLALTRAQNGEKILSERNREMQREIAERRQVEDALRLNEQRSARFQVRLKALHEVGLELFRSSSLDDLFQNAIRLGHQRLGFERIGLLLIDEDGSRVNGTFGIDVRGELRDERGFSQVFASDGSWVKKALIERHRILVRSDVELFDDGQVVGRGWNAMATLWEGERIIGWIATDNLISGQPLDDFQLELLSLYSSMLGYHILQKQTLHKLRLNDERLRLALKTARMVVWDFDVNTRQIKYQVNRNGNWHTEVTPFDTFMASVHPEDQPRIYEALRQSLAEGVSYLCEYRYKGRSGEWYQEYTLGEVYRNAEGASQGVIGVTEDITQRWQAEERFLKAFHSNPSAIAISTLNEGRFIDVNESWAEMFGIPREQHIGRTSLELNLYAFPENRKTIVNALMETGSIRGIETQIRHLRGDILDALCSAELIELDGTLHIITMMQDITGRKRAEQQKIELVLERERVDMLTEFISNISHDLKTPLSVINNTIYLLERLTDPQRQQEKYALIKHQTARLERSIQDIITLSRLDRLPELKRHPVDINTLLQDLTTEFEVVIEKKQINVHYDLDEAIPMVNGSVSELERAFTNLLENALNYTPAQGTVRLRTALENEQVLVEFSDTGIGISDNDLPYIFDRFYRADPARSTHSGGTGLGLAIVKKIVDIHNAAIEVKSEIGVGTRFRIYLPAAAIAPITE